MRSMRSCAFGAVAVRGRRCRRPRRPPTPPTFTNYAAPNGLGTDAGEPSIGANSKTGKVMYQAGDLQDRCGVDCAGTPPTWTSVSRPVTSITSLDPILFTDRTTGRTFVSQLPAGCSLMAFTDDDGATWTPTRGCGIGSRRRPPDRRRRAVRRRALVGPPTSYPHAVYYCAQDSRHGAVLRSATTAA